MMEEQKIKEDLIKEEVKGEVDLIAEAHKAAERLERANKEQLILLQRQERIIAEQRLQGRSVAGQELNKPVEETPEEYAKKLANGTFKFTQ